MQGYTPAEEDIRRKAAGADPDAARYADADRIMQVARVTPGIPFPNLGRDRAVFFYLAMDPAEAEAEVAAAQKILGYALNVSFRPRFTVAYNVRHDILTATLPSGMKIDLVAKAEYLGGPAADVPQLASAA